MEIFELKYFSYVAKSESIKKAADELGITASALSKTISRLEKDLDLELFVRDGRNIKLTESGRLLSEQARKFFVLERETSELLSPTKQQPHIRIAGPDIFLSSFAVPRINAVLKCYPLAQISFVEQSEEAALKSLRDGEAEMAYVTGFAKRVPGLQYTKVASIEFGTYVSARHPLAKSPSVPIAEVLLHDFLSPSEAVLGLTKDSTLDGWRDDKFKRQIRYRFGSVRLLEAIVGEGLAVGYLPSYLGDSLGLRKLTISDCPYHCTQEILQASRTDFFSSPY